MELELTLGDSPAPTATPASMPVPAPAEEGEDHELMLALGVGIGHRAGEEEEKQQEDQKNDVQAEDMEEGEEAHRLPGSPSFELSLRSAVLPESPETRNTCNLEACTGGFDVNTVPALEEDEATVNCLSGSSSSLQMEFSARQAADHEGIEDEENGGGGGRGARKKMRLSKEQSEFLEESFKEQSTLNPKQKLDLAKRLNLRPRQVEVWFQNRRARTKLKQTEVDRQYLKRWCETLTRENRRLQREVAELRALRTAHRPFYPHLSASRCPSCDSVTTARLSPPVVSSPAGAPQATSAALFTKSGLYPFAVHPVLRRRPSATS